MDMLRQARLFGLLTLILGSVPLVMGVVYAIRPAERHLALMRPLWLAGLFGSLSGGVLGFINVFRFMFTRELTADTYPVMAVGAGESLVTLFGGFACLSAAWLLRRHWHGPAGGQAVNRRRDARSEWSR